MRWAASMEWSIESAGPEDIEAVLALWVLANVSQSGTGGANSIIRLIEQDSGALLVARSSPGVIGSLIAAWDGWRGSMYRLVVHPSYRRRGLATALVGHGQARLVALGAK